jgi:hypothetical protein
LGFTFSKGILELEYSRVQESTSETCNAYWAISQLGIALNDRSLESIILKI